MKLRSLALNQFKKFDRSVRLDGIADGLNVVVGPNEMGKSTLLDALRAVLFKRYGSKADPIMALQNDRNQAGPVVELTFEMDDGLYRITKRFIKKPYARLRCPDGRTLEGDAAEDALRTLLRFDEPGKRGAKAETLGMWSVLWVQQGKSFAALDLPETAQSSLRSALESEVGTVLGGRRGRTLPQVIEAQLGELLTNTGRPRGRYREMRDQLEKLQAEVQELQARRQQLSQTLEALEEAQGTLARLSADERDAADQAELESTRARHNEHKALEARIAAAHADLKLKQRNLQQAEKARDERKALVAGIAADEEAVKAARDVMEEVSGRERAARERYETLRAAVDAAQSTVTSADADAALQRRILKAVEREAGIRSLQQQCDQARAAEKRLHEAQQAAAAILVNDKAMETIRAAAKTLESVNAKLTAAATTITFDMAAEALSGIQVDGAPLDGMRPTVHAIDRTTITMPGLGRIIVDPAIRDCDRLLGQQRDARARLTAALNAVNAASVEDAEESHARRQDLLSEATLARHEAALLAPATEEHEAGAQSLAAYIEGLRQVLTREKAELGLEALPTKADAETALKAAERHVETARHDLEVARAQLTGPQEELQRLKDEFVAAKTRYEDAEGRLKKRREELEKAEAARPERQLESEVEAARAALAEQERAVRALEAQRTGETLPQLEARMRRLEEAIRKRQERREALKVEIARLTSRIETLEAAGLDELIQKKSRECEQCAATVARLDREVEVLRLLLSTLRDAERAAKERYLSPVIQRVRPYLQLLFPGSGISIDETLRITGMTRIPGYEEAFHRLSLGTQEQIAILVRLAFAEMLVEQGYPATVILDDALAFSDDRRMNAMFDILNLAAEKVQIIVLTCREQAFDRLGGRQLVLQSCESEEELVSA